MAYRFLFQPWIDCQNLPLALNFAWLNYYPIEIDAIHASNHVKEPSMQVRAGKVNPGCSDPIGRISLLYSVYDDNTIEAFTEGNSVIILYGVIAERLTYLYMEDQSNHL